MKHLTHSILLVFILVLVLALTSGCGSKKSSQAETIPSNVVAEATEAAALATQAAAHATLAAGNNEPATSELSPTETPTPMATATSTPTSSPTPKPAPTATPTPATVTVVVTNPKLNVRAGPATIYKKIDQVKKGDELRAIGRNKENTWLQVITPANKKGWVAAKFTNVAGDMNKIPIAKAPPRPKCRTGGRGLIAFKSNRGGVWVMNPDGSNQMPMCNPNAYYYALNNKRSYEYCSANGLYCVKDDWSPDRRNMDIYVLDNEYGSGWHRIVSNGSTDWGARMEPGGYWVVFVTNRNGNDELWMISRDVTGERRLTANDWQWDKHPTWSPNGKRIAFFSNRVSGRKQIWVLDPNAPLKEKVNPRNVSHNRYVDWDPVWLK
jgi:uncharacterized protein YgiM (DUF1202 family)